MFGINLANFSVSNALWLWSGLKSLFQKAWLPAFGPQGLVMTSSWQGFDRCKYGVLNAMNDYRGVVKCAQYGDSYLVLKDVHLGIRGSFLKHVCSTFLSLSHSESIGHTVQTISTMIQDDVRIYMDLLCHLFSSIFYPKNLT